MFSYRNILKMINYLCRACGVSSASTSIGTAISLIVGKYASSGPVSITLEQAALGGLTVGQQYIISDWQSDLLYAHSATVLKPVSGSVTLMNGETLPAGVEPETLYISLGRIDYDISYDGTPISVVPPTNYNFIFFYVSIFSRDTFINFIGNMDCFWIGEVSYGYSILPLVGKQIDGGGQLIATGSIEGNYFDCYYELRRKQTIVIPTPTLSTPYSSTDGTTITAPFNHIMRDPVGNEDDFTLTVNSSPATIISIALDADPTKFIITPQTPLSFGDVATLSISSGNIKNVWGGVLAEVTNIAITNNVPE